MRVAVVPGEGQDALKLVGGGITSWQAILAPALLTQFHVQSEVPSKLFELVPGSQPKWVAEQTGGFTEQVVPFQVVPPEQTQVLLTVSKIVLFAQLAGTVTLAISFELFFRMNTRLS